MLIEKIDPLVSDFFYKEEFETAKENNVLLPNEKFVEYKKGLRSFLSSIENRALYLAKSDGEIAGFLWTMENKSSNHWDFTEKYAWVYDVRVFPKFRRKGVATILFSEAEKWAISNNFHKMGLHVYGQNTGAIALYKKLAYEVRNEYYQSVLNSSELKASTNRYVTKNLDQSTQKPAYDLIFENYTSKIPKREIQSNMEEINKRFQKIISELGNEKFYTKLIVDDNHLEACFTLYRSKGDIGENEYAWIYDISVNKDKRPELVEYIFKSIYQWCQDANLEHIRLDVHYSQKELLNYIASHNFKRTNVFMHKILQK